MSAKKAFAISAGSYSDYRVYAVFTTEEEARKAADAAGCDVEEFPLYDQMPRRIVYHVIERFPGQEEHVYTLVKFPWEATYFGGTLVRGATYNAWPLRGGTAERAWGTSKEAVRRRWQEANQQREAEEAGL